MIKTILVSGYGINCEEETRYAFEKCGSEATIVHVNDLIENKNTTLHIEHTEW